MGKRIVIDFGRKYGFLTPIESTDPHVTKSGRKYSQHKFRCDCGKTVVRMTSNVVAGKTKSCGCYAQSQKVRNGTTHGLSKHPAYSAWTAMHNRCKESYEHAHNYFDRGVRICPEWRDDPSMFCKWADENGFEQGLELDRRDNDLMGDRAYSPENCHFVTSQKNCQNMRTSNVWHIKGREFASMGDAAEYFGVSRSTISYWANGKGVYPAREDCWRESKYQR